SREGNQINGGNGSRMARRPLPASVIPDVPTAISPGERPALVLAGSRPPTMGYVAVGELRRPAPEPGQSPVSRCPVNAGGIPAEWVEVTAATPEQPTLILFPEVDSSLAAPLAIATGARVLQVGSRRRHERPTVDDGTTVWDWLLREGCDVTTTAFITSSAAWTRAGHVIR